MLSTVNLNRKIVADGSLALYYDFARPQCYISESIPVSDLTIYGNNTEVMQPYPTFTQTPGYSYFTFYDSLNTSVITGSLARSFNPDNTDLTFSWWLKSNASSPANQHHLLQIQSSGTDNTGYVIYITRAGGQSLGFGITNSGGSIIYAFQFTDLPSTVINNGNWNNLALTISNKSMTPYLNGVSYTPVSYSPRSISGTTNFTFLGGTGGGAIYYLLGDLAMFSIYTKALSIYEIQQNYNALKGRFGVF